MRMVPLQYRDGSSTMSDDDQTGTNPATPPAAEAAPSVPDKPLSEPARRALAEAEARRAAIEAQVAALPKELGGRGGKEPGRYGDWEVKGIATDF
jgi:hypothetical protein